ncbi:hypothetical protein HMPREF3232_01043 [Fannyhessea vaginae]|nr:hypothetical protein HMPREF3232_01043 [Fannyhessea vaginae]
MFRCLAEFHYDDWRVFVPMFGGVREDDWKARCMKCMSSSHKGKNI